jgi:hypothetical protein
MKEFQLGILLVHGIGTQPARDTLVRWGDALLKVIRRATAEDPGRTTSFVTRADRGDRSGDKPAEAVVEFRCKDRVDGEKWLIAEGWWAESFPLPTYSELVSWSLRAVPWAIALHIAQRFWQSNPKASRIAFSLAFAEAVLRLLIAMALMPVLMVLPALTLILGLVPQLRSLMLSAQTLLLGTIGDSLAFVESPLRAALIRAPILNGLARLKDRCERTVIVAHSQGAAVILDALGGIVDRDETAESMEPSKSSPLPDALVTFGSGVNQLVSLKVLAAGGLEKDSGINAASVAAMTTLGVIALLIMLFAGFHSHAISIGQLVQASLVMAGAGVLGLALGYIRRLLDGVRDGVKKTVKWTAVILVTVLLTFVSIYFGKAYQAVMNLPVAQVGLLGVLLASLVYAMRTILSPITQAAVTSPVRYPRGLPRWLDIYASKDPVPNGPTRIEKAHANLTSVQVWNRGAALSDHTTYWENLDGFVLRVARVCAETAGSRWQDKLAPSTQETWRDQCAARRVRILRWTLRLNLVPWAVIFFVLWRRYGTRLPVPFSLPSWFWDWGSGVEQFITLAGSVVLGAWITAGLLRWRWSAWVHADQEAVLARKSAEDIGERADPFSGQMIILWLLGWLAVSLALGLEAEATSLLSDPGAWLLASGMLIPIWAFAAQTSSVVDWLLPVPKQPCSDDERAGPTATDGTASPA